MSRLAPLALLLFAPVALGWAGPRVPLNERQVAALLKRNEEIERALEDSRAGDHKKAAEAWRRAAALQASVTGRPNTNLVLALDHLAGHLEALGDWKAAAAARQDRYEQMRQLRGGGDWRVVDARWQLHDARLRLKFAPGQHRALDEAERTEAEFLAHYKKGEFARAAALASRALALRQGALGEKHPDCARSLNNLGAALVSQGDARAALEAFRKALRLRRELIGTRHPHYAANLSNLAGAYNELGDSPRGFPLLREALAVSKDVLGEDHPDYTVDTLNLGAAYLRAHEPRLAIPLYQDVLRRAKGAKPADHARALRGLGLAYRQLGEREEAMRLFEQSARITQKLPNRADHASSLNSQAGCLLDLGRAKEAVPLFRQALALLTKALGEKHPTVAQARSNLAVAHARLKDWKEARRELLAARAVFDALYAPSHPRRADCLYNLAIVANALGERKEALALARESLEGTREYIDLTAAALSERQHLAAVTSLHYRMGLFLSLTEGTADAGAYAEAFYRKGVVLARHRLRRSLAAVAGGKTRRLREQLQDASRRLARLVQTAGPPSQAEKRRTAIQAWARRMDELDTELSRLSGAFSRERATATVAQLQASLPPGAVLVDLLVYGHRGLADEGVAGRREQHLVAFIVPRTGKAIRVGLGPAAPIEEAALRWRAKPYSEAKLLREKLWRPIEKHLGGAKTVLVSPDGALSYLPFGALPGAKPSSYLVEEYAFVTVPVPQLLPALLKRPSASSAGPLLLVSGADFGRPGRGKAPAWPALPGTSAEASAVKGLYRGAHPKGGVTELSGDGATKPAVRAAMPRHSYLHLATHGYFSPPVDRVPVRGPAERRIAQYSITGLYPLARSGLALAGANRSVVEGEEDGLLTALEVAEFDLSGCELAVLSACETGLGKLAGGEGALGLQRAFHLAGARSTICSLWSVSDAATSVLMERFYAGLWGKEKLSRVEALRQAQLYVLRNPDKVAARAAELRGALLKRGVGEAELEGRGLGKKAEKLPAGARHSPVAWWAPFVLSGDWR